MTDDIQKEIRDEHRLVRDTIALQGIAEKYADPPPEFAEYVREFSQDQAIKYDPDSGNYASGAVPEDSIINNWSIHAGNYVFGNIGKDWERKKLDAMELEMEFARSMYKINPRVFRSLPDNIRAEILTKKLDILNRLNLRVYSFTRKTRTKDGNERKWLVTRSLFAGSTDSSNQKSQGWLSKMRSSLFSRGD